MKNKYLLLLAVGLSLTGCATSKTPSLEDQYKGQSEDQLYASGQVAMKKGNYDVAVKYFEAVDTLYPFGKYAEQTKSNLIFSYYKNDDNPSALAAANSYVHIYPRGKYIDYAYYMKGTVEFDQNQGFFGKFFGVDQSTRDLSGAKDAYMDFARVVSYFPNSTYATTSKDRMIIIRDMFARHELQVAKFYFDHEAYVAAINRSNQLIHEYPQSKYVNDASNIVIKSNAKLGLKR